MACCWTGPSRRRDYQPIRDKESVGCCGQEPELTIAKWQTPIYFYIHMYSVTKINTPEQSFVAYYYFRATWTVKQIKEFSEPSNDFEKLGIEKPQIVFMNALSEIELTAESVGFSTYRGHQQGKVVEWKGLVRGTFRFKFDSCDFPFDTQLLTIIMSATEPKWILCEDIYGLRGSKCRSEIRAEYHTEPGFKLGAGRDSLCFLKDTADIPTTWHNRRGEKTSLLAMGVLVTRANCFYHLKNVAVPCFGVGMFQLLIFAADQVKFEQRLNLTVANILLLLPSKFLVSGATPEIGAVTLCELSVIVAFLFLVAALVLLTYKPENDDDVFRFTLYCFAVLYGFLLLAWFWVSLCGCHSMRRVHAKAARKSEEIATVDLDPAFPKRRRCESCCGGGEADAEDPTQKFPFTNPEFPGFVSLFSLQASKAGEGDAEAAEAAPPPSAAPLTTAQAQHKTGQSGEEEKKTLYSDTSIKPREVDEPQQHMSAPSTLFNKLSFGRKSSSAGSKGSPI